MSDIDKNLKNTEFLANYFGLSERRIRQLAADGTISSEKDGEAYYFNVALAAKEYITYLQNCLQGRNVLTEEEEKQRFGAELRLKKAKAKTAELELGVVQSKLHRSEDVCTVFEDLSATIKTEISSLPGRLAMDLANTNNPAEIAQKVETACFEILERLADYEYNPVQNIQKFKEKAQGREGLTCEEADE